MDNFLYFLKEDKNTHLEHLEDDILNDGVRGGRNALAFLHSLSNMLEGSSKRRMNVTVKWDGKPAIWAGTNPENGKFFVGTKAIFNVPGGRVGPKINYTVADIRKNHPNPGLGDKLVMALKYFPALKIPGIWQGDLLFTHEDLSVKDIGGDKSVIFTPNTITYAIPTSSPVAKTVWGAKIGVVWHTSYTGRKMTSLKAKYGVNARRLAKTRTVWATDATFRDTSGSASFTKREAAQFRRVLNMAQGSLKKAEPYLNMMKKEKDKESPPQLLKIFLNSYIRGGEKIENTKKVTAFFLKWYEARLDKKIKTIKSSAGKAKWEKFKKDAISEYNKYQKDLYYVIASYITLQTAKMMIVRKLERAESIGTFLRTQSGYKVTAPEGYVAIDHIGKAIKLVDRLEFSRANFSANDDWKKG